MADRIPLLEIGKLQTRVSELKAKKGGAPWSEALVMTDDIQAFIICHAPGHPNDTHYHLHDEWWVVLQGEINWYIEDEPAPIHARGARPVRQAAPDVASYLYRRLQRPVNRRWNAGKKSPGGLNAASRLLNTHTFLAWP